MKIAYVIGPYRAKSDYGVYKNIRNAEEVAEELWGLGFAVLCPHRNSAFLSGLVPEENFLRAGEEFARMADLIVGVDGWEKSGGSLRERDAGIEAGATFYSSIGLLKDALQDGAEHIHRKFYK